MVTLKRMRSIAFRGRRGPAPAEGRYPLNRIGYGAAAAGQRSGRDLWQVYFPPTCSLSHVQRSLEIKPCCFWRHLKQLWVAPVRRAQTPEGSQVPAFSAVETLLLPTLRV